MTKPTVKVKDIQEVCPMCGGRGQEQTYSFSPGRPMTTTCRLCQGQGFRIVRRIVTQEIPSDEPSD